MNKEVDEIDVAHWALRLLRYSGEKFRDETEFFEAFARAFTAAKTDLRSYAELAKLHGGEV
jgi:hypothetical protein